MPFFSFSFKKSTAINTYSGTKAPVCGFPVRIRNKYRGVSPQTGVRNKWGRDYIHIRAFSLCGRNGIGKVWPYIWRRFVPNFWRFLVSFVWYLFWYLFFCGAFCLGFLIPRGEQFPPLFPTLAHNSSGLPLGYAYLRAIFFGCLVYCLYLSGVPPRLAGRCLTLNVCIYVF